jgi:hypothetical protein
VCVCVCVFVFVFMYIYIIHSSQAFFVSIICVLYLLGNEIDQIAKTCKLNACNKALIKNSKQNLSN